MKESRHCLLAFLCFGLAIGGMPFSYIFWDDPLKSYSLGVVITSLIAIVVIYYFQREEEEESKNRRQGK